MGTVKINEFQRLRATLSELDLSPLYVVTRDAQGNYKHYPFADVAGGGGTGVTDRYINIAAMIAAQGVQNDKEIFYVSDASADATVGSGYAYYEYLGTTAGTIADYRKLTEQESLDLVIPSNKFAISLGDNVTKDFTINHLLNDIDVIIQARDEDTGQIIDMIAKVIDANNVLVRFIQAPFTFNKYRVVIQK